MGKKPADHFSFEILHPRGVNNYVVWTFKIKICSLHHKALSSECEKGYIYKNHRSALADALYSLWFFPFMCIVLFVWNNETQTQSYIKKNP